MSAKEKNEIPRDVHAMYQEAKQAIQQLKKDEMSLETARGISMMLNMQARAKIVQIRTATFEQAFETELPSML